MENRITLTDAIFSKLIYILALCPSLLLTAYSRYTIISILFQIPHESLMDFALKYMQTNSHAVGLSLIAMLFNLAILSASTVFLAKSISGEEKNSRVLSILLILVNTCLIIYNVIISKILFSVVLTIILVGFALIFLLGGFKSSNN
jgi:hypothetical protein